MLLRDDSAAPLAESTLAAAAASSEWRGAWLLGDDALADPRAFIGGDVVVCEGLVLELAETVGDGGELCACREWREGGEVSEEKNNKSERQELGSRMHLSLLVKTVCW